MNESVERPTNGADERLAARRVTMLDAGVGLLGAADGPAVSVRAVCRSTSITERYFYQAFGTRDDYVRAVYHDVSEQARAALAAAITAHPRQEALAAAAVDAFVGLMIDRPDMGRVLLLAPYREPALATLGLGHMPDFFALVAASLPDGVPADVREMTAVGLVGALTALFTQFLTGGLAVDRDTLVDHCVGMLTTAGRGLGR
ncbi:TetR/AcrR family transcriptional regulator [Tsukamurella sp. 8F]|uniref:TetR/AcrR family transcriptional regulator n=1 Tax=unclassified Tsukamurella TaxID=2633480 RepID=UPI0023BA3431|nr:MULTISPECIES: TetR/AcrR family transcriptional regulator [unclassified Tsukamurella]MDF0532183.1 TetR/AcrR family transcriptional regulator [Tsukamurella sp. 8J]MDF0589254.1 TetR/AcrR family transcriptional regulator [Tsukamurella sp. 8F]